jgi:hypothetical protein
MASDKHDSTVVVEAEHLAAEIYAALASWIATHQRAPNAPPNLQRFTIEVLNHAVALLRAGVASPTNRLESLAEWSLYGPPAPHWDRENRVLCVGPHLAKRFKRPSPNQEAILTVFEEEGWPHRIDDPLRPDGDQHPKQRLHDTIKWLNRHHHHRLIRFRGDGTGEGVCWEYVDQPVRAQSAAAIRKVRTSG